MKRGLFIVFEGGEGAGKSTQIRLLAEKLRKEGMPVVVTREPGGTRIGELVRAITHDIENSDLDPVAEAYLMAASRAQYVREVIVPAMDSGKIVISDRFVDSSIAYQGYGRELGGDVIARLNKLAADGARPDIVILLDLDPVIGQKRLDKEGKIRDRLDMQQKDFYKRVRNGFLALAKKFAERYVVIDATATVSEVAFVIWNEIKRKVNSYRGSDVRR
jgi:dTMP kinase